VKTPTTPPPPSHPPPPPPPPPPPTPPPPPCDSETFCQFDSFSEVAHICAGQSSTQIRRTRWKICVCLRFRTDELFWPPPAVIKVVYLALHFPSSSTCGICRFVQPTRLRSNSKRRNPAAKKDTQTPVTGFRGAACRGKAVKILSWTREPRSLHLALVVLLHGSWGPTTWRRCHPAKTARLIAAEQTA